MTLLDLEHAFVRLCCEPTQPELGGDLSAEHAKIWGIYRHMVRTRFLEEAKFGLRRTHQAVGDEALAAMLTRFLAEAPPRSRAFCGVVPELADFAAPRWQGDATVPPWTADLCRYEGTRYRVSDLPARRGDAWVELDFDKVPALHDAIALLPVRFAVHRAPRADGSYREQATTLCVYRGKDQRTIGAYALSPFLVECMDAWQAGATISESVRRYERAHGEPADAKRVDELCSVLADLIERGVVLGSWPQ